MNDDDSFPEFLASIRAGDAIAAEHLVSQFESLVRREVRFRMLDPRLRSVFDSADVCQSVLASFFVRVAAGQFELNNEQDMLRLLISMAKRKTAAVARHAYQQRRDVRQAEAIGARDQADLEASTPSEKVAYAEIAQMLGQQFSEEERNMMNLRKDGCTWNEIAATLGGTADGRRAQLARAADRVCTSLGLNEDG